MALSQFPLLFFLSIFISLSLTSSIESATATANDIEYVTTESHISNPVPPVIPRICHSEIAFELSFCRELFDIVSRMVKEGQSEGRKNQGRKNTVTTTVATTMQTTIKTESTSGMHGTVEANSGREVSGSTKTENGMDEGGEIRNTKEENSVTTTSPRRHHDIQTTLSSSLSSSSSSSSSSWSSTTSKDGTLERLRNKAEMATIIAIACGGTLGCVVLIGIIIAVLSCRRLRRRHEEYEMQASFATPNEMSPTSTMVSPIGYHHTVRPNSLTHDHSRPDSAVLEASIQRFQLAPLRRLAPPTSTDQSSDQSSEVLFDANQRPSSLSSLFNIVDNNVYDSVDSHYDSVDIHLYENILIEE